MWLKHICAAAMLMAGVHAASAQAWPSKPIRVVIPFAAGSATDIIPRTILDSVAPQLGQPMVIENRGGGGTIIGANVVAKADPDGYTLLATSSAHTISHAVFPNMPYDTARDFVAIAPLAIGPNVLIISPSKGLRTAQEFVAAAKAKPGSFNFASAGVGTATHLSAERFRIAAGYEAVHIPFKGGAEALSEVISGRVEYYFCPLGTALPFIKEGKVLALVVSTPTRVSALPDVPSALELYADSDYPFWLGLLGPARLPRDIVEKINQTTMKVLRTDAMKDKLERLGVDPMFMSSAEFSAFVDKDIVAGGALARAVGLKAN
jgi:tripartite-type tricarboxylate transporter receptor subunit TctC